MGLIIGELGKVSYSKKVIHKKTSYVLGVCIFAVSQISHVFASNSNSTTADGFNGFLALFSVGILAFLAPRLRRDSLEDTK